MDLLKNTDIVNAIIAIIAIIVAIIGITITGKAISKKHKAKSKIKGNNNIVIQNSEINKK